MSNNDLTPASNSTILQGSPDEESAPTVATVGAVLAVDIGSLYTRVTLFDVVGDEYRFVARGAAFTTAEPPHDDVTAGVYNAILEIEASAGRRLIDGTRLIVPQRADWSGVDIFIATSSAAPALRLGVATVSADISGESAMRAAMGTYTQVVSRITLDDGIEETPNQDDALLGTVATAWLEGQTEKLLASPPDLILLAGGVDKGPVAPLLRLAGVVARAAREQSIRSERIARAGGSAPGVPLVLFAGNSAALESVQQALAPVSEVRGVPNVRPMLLTEQIAPAERALTDLYRKERMPRIPGYATLSRWVEGEILPTAECERLMARYLYAHYGRETLIADVGATATGIFLANSRGNRASVLGDVGLAYGLPNLLMRGTGNVARWLPFEISEEELQEWALNKAVRPFSLPQTARDLAIEQAFAREALRAANSEPNTSSSRYDLLIGTGGLLAHAPRPGQAALLLLDALQPAAEALGSVELALDSTLLIPALGNLAHHHLAAAAYIFDRDCLSWLGAALVVRGGMNSAVGQTAVTVQVERQGGGRDTVEVAYGSISVVPLRPDQKAALTIRPAPGFRVGGGEPGKALKTQPGQEVKGGLVGLIIDARGRPFAPPLDRDARHSAVRRWWAAFDAIPSSGDGLSTGLFTSAEALHPGTEAHSRQG